ncbi:hypothetical protein BFDFBN_BFDFBN_19045, partial [Dysosmobacter welbionis]
DLVRRLSLRPRRKVFDSHTRTLFRFQFSSLQTWKFVFAPALPFFPPLFLPLPPVLPFVWLAGPPTFLPS